MPCTKCRKEVSDSKPGANVWYCVCGECNFCHVTGVSYTSGDPHWFTKWTENRDKKKGIVKFIKGQSHGGHSFVPLADQSHKRSPQRKNAHGKKRS